MFLFVLYVFFFSSRRRHTRCLSDWSSDVCSSDLTPTDAAAARTDPGNRGVELIAAGPGRWPAHSVVLGACPAAARRPEHVSVSEVIRPPRLWCGTRSRWN